MYNLPFLVHAGNSLGHEVTDDTEDDPSSVHVHPRSGLWVSNSVLLVLLFECTVHCCGFYAGDKEAHEVRGHRAATRYGLTASSPLGRLN